jgi:glycosyltransferase involved in cell wall biosynthesis
METVIALQAQGHQVQSFFSGDLIKSKERVFRQTYQKLNQNNRLLAWTKSVMRDLFELYQNMPEKSLIDSIFRDNDIDLIYERLAQNKSAVSACAQKYGIPLIVESNAPADEKRQYWGAPFFFVTQNLEKNVLERADGVIVVSTPLKRHYQKLGVRSEKIFVLPNGVNEKRFSPENVSRNVRAELKLEGKVVIGFVGNIHKYHGIELLLPLARTLGSSRNDIHYLIVGGESVLNNPQPALVSEDVDRLFTFIDPIPNTEVPDYIAAMDICLLPQFMWYGSPMKILEYGAMGKAIVAPNLENVRDVLVHGETALLFEPENLSALTQAVHELAGDEQLRNRIGTAIRKHILANHTWARNAERITQIYNQIVL